MTITAPTSLDKPRLEAKSTASAKAFALTFLGVLTPIVLTLVGYYLVRNVDAANSRSLGLVQVIPVSFYAVVFLLAASFVIQLRSSTERNLVLSVHVLALILLFHGTVSWIEQTPRFPVTYVHIGFIQYIQDTNHTLPSLDARMSWPGFFAMGALLNKVAGLNSSYDFALWAPLLFNLVYAPLVFSLARTISDDKRVPWLATWLFFTISWVGQDYFSPQAVNFIFFLAFMNIVLHFFRTDRAAYPRGLRGLTSRTGSLVQFVTRTNSLRPGGAAIAPTATWQRGALVATLLVIFGASVVSHQLTPVFLLLEIIALVVLRRIALRGFPLLMVVLLFGYISYGAIGFWSGHISDIFGGFGQVGAVASQNVGNKVAGHSNHTYVIYGRLALTGALWLVAAFGLLRRWRKGLTDIFVMVGFLAPFLVLGGQSYGGEAILRVFLFSLPFAAVLAVLALLPTSAVKFNAVRGIAVVLIASLLAPAFMLARYGNEQFEYVSKNEYNGANQLYSVAPIGSQIVGIDTNTSWGVAGQGDYTFSVASNLAPYDDPNATYQAVASHGTKSTYLYISRTQLEDVAVNNNYPSDWGVGYEQGLVNSGRFTLVYSNPDVAIFKVNAAGTSIKAQS